MALTRVKRTGISEIPDINASKVTAGTLDDARISNQAKVVKSGSAPGSPQEGDLWYDTSNDVLKVYDTTDEAWVKVVRVIPTLSSISGTIVNSSATNLTLTGTGFLAANLIVSFTPDGGSASNVTVTPTSDTAATVAVPSAIYGQSVGVVIGIKVTNSDVKVSNTVNSTVADLPSGGTVTNSGSNRIHTFTSSGNFVNNIAGLQVEYLVIAGAGGSGRQHGGGGGAGGYRCSVVGENSGGNVSAESKLTLSTTGNKTVTIGAGGSGSPAAYARGTSGNDSVFDSITATGGGAGGSFQNSINNAGGGSGLAGGSGGGAGSCQNGGPGLGQGGNTGGAGTSNQGFGGGDSAYAGAGGGGAGGVGEDGAGSSPAGDGGNGGAGLSSSITGSAVARAGGGAGGSYGSSNQTAGSRGIATAGAGNGGWGAESGTNGTANTGGGAGGGGVLANGASSGGSGLVVVRYVL